MMKVSKIKGTLLIAVFIITTLLMTLIPTVSAVDPFVPEITLDSRGAGTAFWGTAQKKFGLYSVRLDDAVLTAVDLGKIELTIDPILLSLLIDDPTYWVYEPTVVAGYHPYVNIYIDFDGVNHGDGVYGTDWTAFEGSLGEAVATGDPSANTWTEMESPTYYGAGTSYTLEGTRGTLDQMKGELETLLTTLVYDTAEVYRIDIMYGMDTTANMDDSVALYVDDITVQTVTYALEPVLKPLDEEYYNTGDSPLVTIYDCDENDDPIRIETVTVEVKSDADAVGIVLTLTETGINTGIFTESFKLVAPVNPGLDELGVEDADEITVYYPDKGSALITYFATVDDKAPVVDITAPATAIPPAKTFISGDAVDVTAEPETSVTFSYKIGGVTFDTEAPGVLDSTEYADGEYIITVVGTDGAGNIGSAEVTVTIDNTGPEVTNYVSAPPVAIPLTETELTFTATVLDAGADAPVEGEYSEDLTVTIDLTEIGGDDDEPMTDAVLTVYDGIFTCEFTLLDTYEVGLYELPITATDSLTNVDTESFIVFEVLEDADDPVIVSTEVAYTLDATSASLSDSVDITVVATDDLSGVASVSIDATELDLGVAEGMAFSEGAWTKNLAFTAEVGTYTLTITATDYAENTDVVTVDVVVALDITGLYVDLEEGWNMFSLPLIPDDSSIEVVLADVMENVQIVWGYKEGVWSKYLPGLPEFSTLTDLVDGEGYWVLITAEDTVTVSGVELPGPGILPPVYDVVEGWNLIGFKSVDFMNINEYLTTVPKTVRASSVSYGWDATIQDYEMVYLGDFPIPDSNFYPGQGYWLYLTEDASIAPPTG